MSGENALVLVVDDEPSIRNSLSRFLKMIGFKVEVAENGEEGLCKVRELKPFIVISDYNMPKKNGLQLFLAVREMAPDVKFILMSTFTRQEIDGLLELEVEFIEKPYKLGELELKIRQLQR